MFGLNPWVLLGILLTLSASHAGMFWRGMEYKESLIENAELKKENQEVRDEAQAFANRPRTRSDRVGRLCGWAEYVAEIEGSPIKRLPAFCGEGSE